MHNSEQTQLPRSVDFPRGQRIVGSRIFISVSCKNPKNYKQVNSYLLQAFSHRLEFVTYFLMKEIWISDISNWVPKICCENTFSVFIFTSFYFILKRTWVEQNLIFFMYSQIKNLNPYFLSFIHHFSKSSHTLLFLSNVLFASCDPA